MHDQTIATDAATTFTVINGAITMQVDAYRRAGGRFLMPVPPVRLV